MNISEKLEKIEGPFNVAAKNSGGSVVISFYEDDYSGPDNKSVEYVGLYVYKIEDADMREDGVVVAASGDQQTMDKAIFHDLAEKVWQATGLELRIS